MIRHCGCNKDVPATAYQNRVYGMGYRVHTTGNSVGGKSKYTCTVCGKVTE